VNNFLKDNRLYFIPLLVVFILSALFLYFNMEGEELVFFSNNRNPVFNTFFRGVNFLGEAYFYLLSGIVFLLMRKYFKALSIFFTGITVLFLSQALKNFFSRPRPSLYFSEVLKLPDALQPVPGVELLHSYTSSFPSGHTTAAFALYGLLALFISRPSYLKTFFVLPAVLAGTARIYLGQHFLSDVLAGAIVGTLLALAMYLFYRLLSAYFKNVEKDLSRS
jgi:membrane-associated phospholipid phosphatase